MQISFSARLFWTSFPDVYLGKACTAKPGHNGVKSIMQFEFAFAKIYDKISRVNELNESYV